MKSLNDFSEKYNRLKSCSFVPLFVGLILFFTSCTGKPEPYSILEIAGEGEMFNNYSKSSFLTFYQPDSINPTAMIGNLGDLFVSGDYIFLYNDTLSQNKFLFKLLDEGLYVNGKIVSISIPNNEDLIPWFESMNERDFSALQFIRLTSEMPESYLPCLAKLAGIKPDAGLFFDGNFEDMARLLKVFKPRYIAGPDLHRSDYALLSGLTGLEILMVSLEDSVISDPLPSLPSLKQIFLGEFDKDLALTDNFLINNKQIERVIIQNPGDFDFSLLKPLINLKELVVRESDTIMNIDLINDHTTLEVLSITGDEPEYNPVLIRLPSLRWMAFCSNVTQEEFDFFVDIHPDLEIIEIVRNRTINSLQALSKLSKLSGLTVTDTVTDIASITTLTNLKYLSLPDEFLNDSINKAELQTSLPETRIVANVPFCLGSGWLLLLIPLVLIIRFFTGRGSKSFRRG